MTILITGANGFIGRHLCRVATEKGLPVRRAVRKPGKDSYKETAKGLLDPNFDWTRALKGIHAVVHLAARVHLTNYTAKDPLNEYQKVNTHGTMNLARQAAGAGVERFVFISSIGVNGRCSKRPFTEKDPPRPDNPYAMSKLEAEAGLQSLDAETGMEIVIIRPPLVYGPGAPGNFARLVRLVQKGLPLPFALVRNKRSLTAIDNLADLILACIDNPAAAGQTFLVSDSQDLSTPELIQKLALAMGLPARLFPVPPLLLGLAGRMIGKRHEIEQLTGSLQVDISHTCETLGWRPPVSVDEGLKRAVGYRSRNP